VAADWHEVTIIPQCIMWPSREQLDPGHGAVCRHTTAPVSHMRPSPHRAMGSSIKSQNFVIWWWPLYQ